jgi:hypothetical protein
MKCFEDAAGDFAEACIAEGVTVRQAIRDLGIAWVDKFREQAEQAERQFARIEEQWQ